MKKALIITSIFFAMVLFSFANIDSKTSEKTGTTLASLTFTSTACAECDWDNFWQGQGCSKDEREYSSPCPDSTIKVQVCVEYNDSGACIKYEEQTVHSGRNEIDCLYGTVNCTPTGWFHC